MPGKRALFLHGIILAVVVLLLTVVKSSWKNSLTVLAQYPTETPTRTVTPLPSATPTNWIVYTPPDDAYVNADTPTTNYGGSANLRVRDNPPIVIDSYLKFVVTGLTRPVQSATVRLYVSDYSPEAGTIYQVSNNYQGTVTPWGEGGLTWDNAPVIGGTAISSGGVASIDTWVSFDVTTVINGNGTYSFAVTSDTIDAVWYNSSEAAANQPQLIIIEEPLPPITPTLTPTRTVTPTPTITPTLGVPDDEGTVKCTSDGSQVVNPLSCGPITSGTDELVVITVLERGSIRVNNISGLGLTYNRLIVQCAANGSQAIELWTAYGSPATGNISVNFSGSNYALVYVTKYSNVDPASPYENATGSNANGQESTNCTSGPSNEPSLNVSSTINNALIHVGTGTRNQIIDAADADYTLVISDINNTGVSGNYINSYLHKRIKAVSGPDTISHGINGSGIAAWVMAALVVRPIPPPPTPSPTFYQIYGYIYTEKNNDADDRSTAVSEGLLGGYQVNLTGDAEDITFSQGTEDSLYPANYVFTPLYDGIYEVRMPEVPANSVVFNPQNYTNPQKGIIIAGGPVIVDFPFVPITPTFSPGTPTPTKPGGGLPTHTPSPTPLSATPTNLPTPTSILTTPPESCQTLPTPELKSPPHELCTNSKPLFSAFVFDPNGDNVWARFTSNAYETFDAMGGIVAPAGDDSLWNPPSYVLNSTGGYWWTARTESSSCPASAEAPARLITMDFTPPPAPDPPVCTLISQNYVTGETTFQCSWNEVISNDGCGYTVSYHPYFWTSPPGGMPGGDYWDADWIGDQTSITVVTTDGVELYGIVEARDNLGNISLPSGIGGNFTAPRINYSFTPTPGGVTPSITPIPTVPATPTPGAWLQVRGGDVYQPIINQPVPAGEYFLDFMPTPADNPNSIGVIWSVSGGGNYGLGGSSPVEWEAIGTKSNAYSFTYYWETLKNKAKVVNNSIVGVK